MVIFCQTQYANDARGRKLRRDSQSSSVATLESPMVGGITLPPVATVNPPIRRWLPIYLPTTTNNMNMRLKVTDFGPLSRCSSGGLHERGAVLDLCVVDCRRHTYNSGSVHTNLLPLWTHVGVWVLTAQVKHIYATKIISNRSWLLTHLEPIYSALCRHICTANVFYCSLCT